ncbi:hypothetical protein FQN60_015369, partial [Etheostoma spectabile]
MKPQITRTQRSYQFLIRGVKSDLSITEELLVWQQCMDHDGTG